MMRVNKIDVNKVTGLTDIELVFRGTNGNDVTDKQSFLNQESAIHYIRKSQKDYILTEIERWVLHKESIMNENNYYQPNKKEALKRCKDFLKWGLGYDGNFITLQEVCKYALIIRGSLDLLMPWHKNPSYESSRTRLAEIMAMCQNIYNELKTQKAA